jgi:trehalose/maltose hydrolase-like predicted phosphorylase
MPETDAKSACGRDNLLAFDAFRPDDELRRESIFGLGNGVLFVRASAPEARLSDPPRVSGDGVASRHYPGLYRAGLYDLCAVEVGGHFVRMTSAPRLPNATVLAVRRPDGPWLGCDRAELLEYRHAVDLCSGLALRRLVLRDAHGTTEIEETRFVSHANPWLIGFLRSCGAEMIVEIARMWSILVEWNASTGRYDIGRVMGPDEYHDAYPGSAQAGVVNNAYTNVMAMWTLWSARDILADLPPDDRAALTAKLDLANDEP